MNSLSLTLLKIDDKLGFNEPLKNKEAYRSILIKANYIKDNEAGVISDVIETLSSITNELDWIQIGRIIHDLMKRTNLDIALKASYLYFKFYFPDILAFMKKVASCIVDTLFKNGFMVFNEHEIENSILADHETAYTYKTDLCEILRMIRRHYKNNQMANLKKQLYNLQPR